MSIKQKACACDRHTEIGVVATVHGYICLWKQMLGTEKGSEFIPHHSHGSEWRLGASTTAGKVGIKSQVHSLSVT